MVGFTPLTYRPLSTEDGYLSTQVEQVAPPKALRAPTRLRRGRTWILITGDLLALATAYTLSYGVASQLGTLPPVSAPTSFLVTLAATAPIVWLQFHAIPLLSVPANLLAAPAVVPLLGLALASAAVYPLAPSISAALGWLNGWCAAYLAGCARLVGGLPFAQVRSGGVAAVLGIGVLSAAAYAWRRWPTT